MRATANTYSGQWQFAGSQLTSALPGLPYTIYNLPASRPEGHVFFATRVFRRTDAPVPPPYNWGMCSFRKEEFVYFPAN